MQTVDERRESETGIEVAPTNAETCQKVRAKLRTELTRLLTASVLCDADFPNVETLPRVAEVPYAHLGHQVLLDYRQFATDVWAVVRSIQSRISVQKVRTAQILS